MAKGIGVLAVLVASILSFGAQAGQYLCSATQSSYEKPAELGEECPVGNALWGNSKPKHKNSTFWIQCGLFPEGLTMGQVETLYPNVSASIWNKQEKKGMRCLIGPYDDFSQVRLELTQLKTVTGFESAFIREVRK
ncbi:hypothetical protein JCM19232_2353 [Vibrio ishigakensis]|uniref:Uncharacterized protein n=1 Tax=Vibrio ishigakensis TaxID=1481914 RepID=A0A0B8PLG0_9VIBR|nr:SPOR domain-containing protein [Vibrio ishigakensis]GAM56312.1 hypothetical protein JCM19231_393 [Vibrio ishigakensis]GAM63943.1 hypothetical protein JCM19232_2353 [Vibrio ishigakensis]GAM72356.1 hypothetical protein JCM19236_3462 [Vibrio sp. JCM 19236]